MKYLKPFFIVTDIGFILYWLLTLFNLIPLSVAFKDYHNPIMVAWNWSFFPLDMFVSFTGLSCLYFYRKNDVWKKLCLISLVLTFCSGLQAIAFWAFKGDFDVSWWAINGYLLIYPLYFIYKIIIDTLE